MMSQFLSCLMLFCITVNVIAVTSKFNDQLPLMVRQCSCHEVYECLNKVWKEMNCSYKFGSTVQEIDGRGLGYLEKCSMKNSFGFCSTDKNHFIVIDDFGYVKTKDLEKEDEQICFNQNVIQCFKSKNCDIPNHNQILKNIHYQCSKGMSKYMIELVSKYPDLVPASLIEKAKSEYAKKFNENFDAKMIVASHAYRNILSKMTIFGLIVFCVIF